MRITCLNGDGWALPLAGMALACEELARNGGPTLNSPLEWIVSLCSVRTIPIQTIYVTPSLYRQVAVGVSDVVYLSPSDRMYSRLCS